jgi:hypothetical protein
MCLAQARTHDGFCAFRAAGSFSIRRESRSRHSNCDASYAAGGHATTFPIGLDIRFLFVVNSS